MKLKTIAILSIALLVAAACGQPAAAPSPTAAPTAAATAKPAPVELLVWSHLQPPEIDAIDKVAQQWATATGNKVKVVLDTGEFDAAVTAIQGGKGPDLMYGLPHDNLGKFQKAGQLAAVPSGIIDASAYLPTSIAAVSFEGKLLAVPVSMEAVALFYRTDKVKELPKTFDDLRTQAKGGLGFRYNVKDLFFSFGLIAGYGGYVFKDKGGGNLDPSDLGLGNDGAKQAYQALQDMVQKDKLMPADENYDNSKAAFISGKAAFHINGPWEVDNFKKANIQFAVAKVPPIASGKPWTPFVGVQAAFVNAKTSADKQKAAFDLLKKLQSDLPLNLFKVGNRIPVQKALLENAEVKSNTNLSAFAASASDGIPMPNIAAMGAVWGPTGGALDLLAQNKLTPSAAADKIVKEVKEGIAQQK